MRYCVSGRQLPSILKQADEIKMKYEDRERIIDYIQMFPDKTIILEIPKGINEIEWKLLDVYAQSIELILCLYDFSHLAECIEHNMKYYWGYPITSYYELRGILDLNPYYIYLGAPLSFDLKHICEITKTFIRLCPNVAYDAYIPRKNGICGQWIRPEDVKEYEPYVRTLEFVASDLTKEKTLLHIYKDNQEWPGDLGILITNFGVSIDNRALPEEFGSIRTTCGQRCMQNGTCHYCISAMRFAEAIREKYNENLKNNIEN